MKLKRMVSFLLANKYNRWIPCLLSQTDARLCHCVCQFFARICARGTWAMSISIVFMGFSFVCDFIKSIYEISRSDILLPNMYLTCIILFATEYLFRMLPLKCEHFFVHLCIEWIRFFVSENRFHFTVVYFQWCLQNTPQFEFNSFVWVLNKFRNWKEKAENLVLWFFKQWMYGRRMTIRRWNNCVKIRKRERRAHIKYS